jgi:hypothetical protein
MSPVRPDDDAHRRGDWEWREDVLLGSLVECWTSGAFRCVVRAAQGTHPFVVDVLVHNKAFLTHSCRDRDRAVVVAAEFRELLA